MNRKKVNTEKREKLKIDDIVKEVGRLCIQNLKWNIRTDTAEGSGRSF